MATVLRPPLISRRPQPPATTSFVGQNLLETTLARPFLGRAESKTILPPPNVGYVNYFEPFLLLQGAKPFNQLDWRPTKPIFVSSMGYIQFQNPPAQQANPPGRYFFGQTQQLPPNQGYVNFYEPSLLLQGARPFSKYDWPATQAIPQNPGFTLCSTEYIPVAIQFPFSNYIWSTTKQQAPSSGWVFNIPLWDRPFSTPYWPQTQAIAQSPGWVKPALPDYLNQGTMPFVNFWFGTTTILPSVQGWVVGRIMQLPDLPPGKTTAWLPTQVAQVVGWQPQNFPQFVLATQGAKPFAQYDWRPTQPTQLLPPGFVLSSDVALLTFIPPVFTGVLRNPPYVGVSPGQMGTWGTW